MREVWMSDKLYHLGKVLTTGTAAQLPYLTVPNFSTI